MVNIYQNTFRVPCFHFTALSSCYWWEHSFQSVQHTIIVLQIMEQSLSLSLCLVCLASGVKVMLIGWDETFSTLTLFGWKGEVENSSHDATFLISNYTISYFFFFTSKKCRTVWWKFSSEKMSFLIILTRTTLTLP